MAIPGRVRINGVTQERATDTFVNPVNGQVETLHDRPPLVLRATVDPLGVNPGDVIVVVNHLRSFIDIELVSGEGVRVCASPDGLGSPNHAMVTVSVPYSASDASGPPACSISVRSNEPTDGQGDGQTATDWQVLDGHTVLLRSERSGKGTGRIYTLTVSCTDASGNTASATATVTVSK